MQPLLVDQSQNIPPELWVNIFSHVTPKEMGVLSSVCRNFSNISCDQLLWRALAQRDYPDTYAAQLSERQIVQETEEGNKKRKVASPDEIDWKQQFIERALFFSAAKKGQLKCTTILTPDIISTDTIDGGKYLEKERIFSLDFFDTKPFAGVKSKLVTFDDQDKLVEITPEQGAIITSIKVEKRKDGTIYVYNGDDNGNIFRWEFNGSQFEQKKNISKGIDTIIALEIYQETLISLGYSKVRLWDKEEGTLLETFKSIDPQEHYRSLAVDKNLILASMSLGIIKIWDAITRKSLGEIRCVNNQNDFTDVVLKIRVVGNKIFYSNDDGIFAFDLEQKSITHLVNENLMSYDFEVFDGKIFYYRMIEKSFRGICIFDIKTSTVESGPFSPSQHIDNFGTSLKIVPHGILHSGENLCITHLSKKG